MKRVVVAPEADESLREIFRYTFDRWGEEQARKYLEQLRDACNGLSENPSLGRLLRCMRDMELRQIQVGRHIVIYALRPADILVLAVLHDAMNLAARRKSLVRRLRTKGIL